MPLDRKVRIARRFQRSIRIDTDLKDESTLEGFVCPKTFTDVLMTMSSHIGEKGHGAFTWTGPYGSGKSSLAVAFSALVNGNFSLHKKAERVFGQQIRQAISRSMPAGSKGWRVLPVVGRRDDPVRVIGEAMRNAGFVSRVPRGGWTESGLLKALVEASSVKSPKYGGLILLIDELGKFLEAAAQEGRDLHFFQQIAELSSRSNGRLVVIGILHQAFAEYAHRLSSQMRDEWTKIHGRYVDLVVDFSGEEQIYLLTRAIDTDRKKTAPSVAAKITASFVRPNRKADARSLAELLESCWPLHPIVACLLGPVSRRRFGQNQRSIFGFLNSSEPHGFQDFLQSCEDDQIFTPDRLWDYLRANLEPSILASPDGHRWALAAEAIERCENMGGNALHTKLLKSIAVIDLFKERSGLVASFELLKTCFSENSEATLRKALGQLNGWSLTVFRKFVDAHAIFAGSDFDIERAAKEALAEIDELDFASLKSLAGIQPILAKKHYHETGTLRWFDVNITSLGSLQDATSTFNARQGAIGQFLLAIPAHGETFAHAERLSREAAQESHQDWDNIVGISKRSLAIAALAREVLAMDRIRDTHPALAGDAVARKEVSLRLAALQAQLETEISKSFEEARWFMKDSEPIVFRYSDLNRFASDLADARFNKCPRLHNELVNRQKPSGSAIAAQNALLRRMVLNQGEKRLGINGFPAEGGLFSSILEATGLYAEGVDGWTFVSPPRGRGDHFRLNPIWTAALEYVKKRCDRTVEVSEIYTLWRQQPYGVKDGILPVLATSFILSQQDSLAIYREGIFRARFTDVDVEYLAKDPGSVQLRWMDLSVMSRNLLSGMAAVVRTLDAENALVHLEPIDVARGLVSIYERLPLWTKRTMQLSANALRVREMFQRARDPNRFLFDDLPRTVNSGNSSNESNLKAVISQVQEGLEELVNAYPTMLGRLRETMLAELQVPNVSPQSLLELRERASNIRQLAGDFRLEAFVGRLIQFDHDQSRFEGIASLVANKPSRDWVDLDVDRATIDVADLAQKFLRAETFARVKGRKEKRHAFAVVMGIDNRPRPVIEEFEVADTDRSAILEVVNGVTKALQKLDTTPRNIILAGLAEVGMRFMEDKKKAAPGRSQDD